MSRLSIRTLSDPCCNQPVMALLSACRPPLHRTWAVMSAEYSSGRTPCFLTMIADARDLSRTSCKVGTWPRSYQFLLTITNGTFSRPRWSQHYNVKQAPAPCFPNVAACTSSPSSKGSNSRFYAVEASYLDEQLHIPTQRLRQECKISLRP